MKKKNDYNFFLIKLTLIHRFQINQQKKSLSKGINYYHYYSKQCLPCKKNYLKISQIYIYTY